MKLLKIFKGRPLKRIEAKFHSDNSKVRFRVSRTSGINASVKLGRNATYNTKHGFRISKTIKGLTLGLKRGGVIIRGRWSTSNKLFNLNLSKSGFTVSSSSRFGTFNWTKPNRSSFKFMGIQLRGKRAQDPAFLFSILTIGFAVISYLFLFLAAHIRLFLFLILYLIILLVELVHLFIVDIPLLFRWRKFTENYESDFFPEGFINTEELDLEKIDKRLAIGLAIGPFAYNAMVGFLSGSMNINLPDFVEIFNKFYEGMSYLIIPMLDHILFLLGVGLFFFLLNLLVDWLVFKIHKIEVEV